MEQEEQILCAILDAGETLLVSGAEVARVEDTIRRMALAYGFVRTDVLSITASMIVTAWTARGATLTQTRRIVARSTDLRRIEAVNALSRAVCAAPPPLAVLRERIDSIRHMPEEGRWQLPLAYLLVSGSFAVFFGGTARDGLAAMLCSMLLYAIGRAGARIRLQPLVLTVVGAAAMCFAAVITVWLGIGQALDKIVIGNIMLLIPGIALLTSLRDMIVGDTISGLLGAFEALLRALAIAAGCALVLLQMGGAA
ncbi:MAG: threonine/serine exporter family protein [Agathobaculum sp.]|uniref:threonine/serine exporter family protein n=1 Tax=Agathobaculum sp. TaxID=2048138 RepID=UPI0025C6B0B1|nr:threonine/serine exporter family protein [Agathobaculum sp.]MCI7125804.1 threonine/serine exporter family protein [Agathobaculum sp.]MDY3711410.1 threonine/serine exporter family protein [Agathobaculum sp.]